MNYADAAFMKTAVNSNSGLDVSFFRHASYLLLFGIFLGN